MWTQGFIRTALIFLVTMTLLVRESDGDAETWIKLFDVINWEWVSVLEAGENQLYAGTSERIFISQNDGYSWYTVTFKDLVTAITADGDTVYAGTWSTGVFRSDDAGVTWKPILNGLRVLERDDGERFYGIVYRILVRGNEIINVMYHKGTYVSNDRGETWHDVSGEWELGDSIQSMTEFDGYLWSAISAISMRRSPDNGRTWEHVRQYKSGRINDWAVLNNRLYIAGSDGIGRWNEQTRDWEYPMKGLPSKREIYSLAVHEGRLFAGLRSNGVYVFDAKSEIWFSVGLDKVVVRALLSYKSSLYAGTDDGLYSTRIPRVQPHGKAVATWGRIKRNASD